MSKLKKKYLLSNVGWIRLGWFRRCIQGVRGAKGEDKYRTPPPQANFKTLVNKNAIKPEIGGPPWHFFLKALTPFSTHVV